MALSSLIFNITDKDWVIIKSKAEGYQVAFPGQPVEENESVDSELGKLKMNMLTYEVTDEATDKNLVYLFNYTDYPEGKLDYSDSAMVESILDGAVNGAAKNVEGKIISVTPLTYKEHAGKEVRIDFKDGMAVIAIRCYLVKNRIYLLEVIALTENDKNENQSKFLNSFELL